ARSPERPRIATRRRSGLRPRLLLIFAVPSRLRSPEKQKAVGGVAPTYAQRQEPCGNSRLESVRAGARRGRHARGGATAAGSRTASAPARPAGSTSAR